MAGLFPDVPAPRMAYDRDGSTGFTLNGNTGVVTPMSAGNLQELNDEDAGTFVHSTPVNGNHYWGFIFPQLRDLAAYFLCIQSTNNQPSFNDVQTSVDTTNGLDGTWDSHGNWVRSTSLSPAYRNDIQTLSVPGVKAIRWRTSGIGIARTTPIEFVHLYGTITAGETPDRLRVWHPTLDEPLDENNATHGAYFDWGNVQRGTVPPVKQFRIKNESATLTAEGITLIQSALSDASPTLTSQYTFSDGGAFSNPLNIGDLGPGAISAVISKRYTPPSNAALVLWTSRTVISATSWS